MPITKENAHQYLPLVQALAEGKTVQVNRPDKGWVEPEVGLTFLYQPQYYRIKPEPLRFTVMVPKLPDPQDPKCWKLIEVEEVLK